MVKLGDIEEKILTALRNKYWDFPSEPDEMRITSYDANDNPLIIEYYKQNRHLFTHNLTYDGSGRLINKILIRQ
jgi:hypothetical protein